MPDPDPRVTTGVLLASFGSEDLPILRLAPFELSA
jgi:hypothetical protein